MGVEVGVVATAVPGVEMEVGAVGGNREGGNGLAARASPTG